MESTGILVCSRILMQRRSPYRRTPNGPPSSATYNSSVKGESKGVGTRYAYFSLFSPCHRPISRLSKYGTFAGCTQGSLRLKKKYDTILIIAGSIHLLLSRLPSAENGIDLFQEPIGAPVEAFVIAKQPTGLPSGVPTHSIDAVHFCTPDKV